MFLIKHIPKKVYKGLLNYFIMKPKIKSVDLYITPGTFYFLFRRAKEGYDFSQLSELRRLLSNEKAKLINIIKTKQPDSIYKLAKLTERDFKAVQKDLKILKSFGIIDLQAREKGGRKQLKPVTAIDKLQINIDFT